MEDKNQKVQLHLEGYDWPDCHKPHNDRAVAFERKCGPEMIDVMEWIIKCMELRQDEHRKLEIMLRFHLPKGRTQQEALYWVEDHWWKY